MTTQAKFDVYNVAATEDLTANSALFKAVGWGGTITPSPLKAAGVLQSKGAIGQQVAVAYDGIVNVVAGAVVTTPGFPLTITTSGFFIACTSGGVSVGRAITAAASGDLIPAFVDFKNLPMLTLA